MIWSKAWCKKYGYCLSSVIMIDGGREKAVKRSERYLADNGATIIHSHYNDSVDRTVITGYREVE